MSGGRRAAKAAAPPEKPQPEKAAAEKRPGRAAAASPAAAPSPAKPKKGGAAASDACQDALLEARDMAAAVADVDEGISDKPASPPPVPKRSDRTMTLELQKEKAERARLEAETERLKKQLDEISVRESKRKQSKAAEPAPRAKRAAGSGRRTAPQSAAVSRRRLSVCTSISVIDFFVT